MKNFLSKDGLHEILLSKEELQEIFDFCHELYNNKDYQTNGIGVNLYLEDGVLTDLAPAIYRCN